VYLLYVQVGGLLLLALSPLVTLLLVALHYYHRQQEVQAKLEEAQLAAAAMANVAAQRKREAAARHVTELRLSERRFHGAFAHACVGMALMEFGGRILQANQALAKLLARPEDTLENESFQHFVHADDRAAFAASLANALRVAFEPFTQRLRVLDLDGGAHWALVHCSYFQGPALHGEVESGKPCLFLQVQDLKSATAVQDMLLETDAAQRLAHLPRRQGFMEQTERVLRRQRHLSDGGVTVLAVALDVAQTPDADFVREDGSALLRSCATRLQSALRPGDMLAWVGAREFAVLMDPRTEPEHALVVAQRLSSSLLPPLDTADGAVSASAQIGVAWGGHGVTAEGLWQQACAARRQLAHQGSAGA
jgi:PAS domain S-box-containing protein